MPELHAFRGLRYDLGHVGNLSDVIAPPYDVIDDNLQNQLYERHPANVVRLILNRQEPGDDEGARYVRAARFLKNWIKEGILATEPDPALYVYHQQFEFAGTQFNRRGFMGAVRLQRFGEGNIYPHEETHAAAKADRLKLTTACRANLSQIFGIYRDETNEAQELLEAEIVGKIPLEATDHLGVVHRLWPVTDVRTIADVAASMGPKPIFVADGHHRYETACNYLDQLSVNQTLSSNHPAHCVLMMCVSMSDPGMIVLPTHRLLSGIEPTSSSELCERLGEDFTTEVFEPGPDKANQVWATIEAEADQGALGLFAAHDQRWILARITDRGRARMAQVAKDHSADWQGLGVAMLHRLIIETILRAEDLPKPTYVHEVAEVVKTLDENPGQFPLAALVMPATVDHIQTISELAERMPAKSTYFYPKLLSGLVIKPLE